MGATFAYIVHFVFLRDVWIRTQRAFVFKVQKVIKRANLADLFAKILYRYKKIQKLMLIPSPMEMYKIMQKVAEIRTFTLIGSDQRENRGVWSNINTRYLVWRCGDGRSFVL